MADIAMCLKSDCPSFATCYRAQAAENEYRQAYMDFNNKDKERCDDYIPIKTHVSE